MSDDLQFQLPKHDAKVVVVLSGGLDSTILTYGLVREYGAKRVHAISFYYGQKQKLELSRARLSCIDLGISHKVMDLTILGQLAKNVSANISDSDIAMPNITQILGDPQPKTYVPFRNMILLSLAFSYAESIGAEYIFSGLQSTDQYGYWDTTPQFIEAINNVASQNRLHKIALVAPFSKLSKYDEIMLSKDWNVRYDYTLTCYNPDERGVSCGKCPSCSERIAAFKKARIADTIEYSKES